MRAANEQLQLRIEAAEAAGARGAEGAERTRSNMVGYLTLLETLSERVREMVARVQALEQRVEEGKSERAELADVEADLAALTSRLSRVEIDEDSFDTAPEEGRDQHPCARVVVWCTHTLFAA